MSSVDTNMATHGRTWVWAERYQCGLGGPSVYVNAGRKEAESERSHVSLPEPDETLPSKPQPHSNTQITRNGLN